MSSSLRWLDSCRAAFTLHKSKFGLEHGKQKLLAIHPHGCDAPGLHIPCVLAEGQHGQVLGSKEPPWGFMEQP